MPEAPGQPGAPGCAAARRRAGRVCMAADIVRRAGARPRVRLAPRRPEGCAAESCRGSSLRRVVAFGVRRRGAERGLRGARPAVRRVARGAAAAARRGRARLHADGSRPAAPAARRAAGAARRDRPRRAVALRARRPHARRIRDERARLRPAGAQALVAQPGLLRERDRRPERHAGARGPDDRRRDRAVAGVAAAAGRRGSGRSRRGCGRFRACWSRPAPT